MDHIAFNTALAKRLQNLKKDLGATKVRQGYKGTGGQSHRRQIWVDFGDAFGQTIDLWLDTNVVGLGGVCRTNYGKVPMMRSDLPDVERSIDDVYTEIVEKLRPLATVKRCDSCGHDTSAKGKCSNEQCVACTGVW